MSVVGSLGRLEVALAALLIGAAYLGAQLFAWYRLLLLLLLGGHLIFPNGLQDVFWSVRRGANRRDVLRTIIIDWNNFRRQDAELVREVVLGGRSAEIRLRRLDCVQTLAKAANLAVSDLANRSKFRDVHTGVLLVDRQV